MYLSLKIYDALHWQPNMLIKVKNNQSLKRDSYSGAIINTNEEEYHRAVAAARKANNNEARISAMEESIAGLQEDISVIKDLMTKFMERY